MKIAILGSGNVGGALDAALSRVGHDVATANTKSRRVAFAISEG